MPEEFGIREMMAKSEEKTPYTVVAIQECESCQALLVLNQTLPRLIMISYVQAVYLCFGESAQAVFMTPEQMLISKMLSQFLVMVIHGKETL